MESRYNLHSKRINKLLDCESENFEMPYNRLTRDAANQCLNFYQSLKILKALKLFVIYVNQFLNCFKSLCVATLMNKFAKDVEQVFGKLIIIRAGILTRSNH